MLLAQSALEASGSPGNTDVEAPARWVRLDPHPCRKVSSRLNPVRINPTTPCDRSHRRASDPNRRRVSPHARPGLAACIAQVNRPRRGWQKTYYEVKFSGLVDLQRLG